MQGKASHKARYKYKNFRNLIFAYLQSSVCIYLNTPALQICRQLYIELPHIEALDVLTVQIYHYGLQAIFSCSYYKIYVVIPLTQPSRSTNS